MEMKKQTIYTVQLDCFDDRQYIMGIKNDLYEKFESVMATPNGKGETRFICENEIGGENGND